MGNLHNRKAWEQLLPPDVVNALEAWLSTEEFDLHHCEWLTDGGSSDGPVARAIRNNTKSTRQVVLQFCKLDGNEIVSNLRQAWSHSYQFRAHLANTGDQAVRIGDRFLIIMHIPRVDLSDMRALSALFDRPDFPDKCGTIVQSILREWNDNHIQIDDTTIAAVLNEIIGRRRDDITEWMRSSGLLVDGSPSPVSRSGWPTPLSNPFALIAGSEGNRRVNALVGAAHGDLHGGSILLPPGPSAVGSYFLIDYARFSNRAPLARDPMNLLVTLVLARLDEFEPLLRLELARVLVNPNVREVSPQLDHIREISAAIHLSSEKMAEKSGLRTEWTAQCLLSLVGVALTHIGRMLNTADQSMAKDWCLYLAAFATDSYLKMFGHGNNEVLLSSPTGNDGTSRSPADATAGHIYDVAVSFAGEQRTYVEHFVSACTKLGIRVFYDRDQTVDLWGQNFIRKFRQVYGGAHARYVITFLSKDYLDKPYPMDEFNFAILEALRRGDVYILPVLFENIDVPEDLLNPATGFLRAEEFTPEQLADIVAHKVKNLGRKSHPTRGVASVMESAIQARLPRIAPLSFSSYETLEDTLKLIGEYFQNESSKLAEYGFRCHVRVSDTSVNVRIEERGRQTCALRVRFDESFEYDRLTITFGWPRITGSEYNGFLTTHWDETISQPRLRYTDITSNSRTSANKLITGTEFFVILWDKVIDFIEQRG